MKNKIKTFHKKDVYWQCYPPFIDAYKTCDTFNSDYRSTTSKKQGIADLHKAMFDNMYSWQNQTIGEQVLRTGEPLKVNGKYVLNCGYFSYETASGICSNQSFILLANRDDRENGFFVWCNFEIIKFDYPNEWNVT